LATRFRRLLPRNFVPITILIVYNLKFQPRTCRKFATLCSHRHWHHRAQPSKWLYDHTPRCLARTGAIKVAHFSGTTRQSVFSYHLLFSRLGLYKGNLLLARGPRIHSLYPLYVMLREGDLFVVDRRLGHLSKTRITYLSKANYIPKLSFSDNQFCEHS
jgi:hypothetical protein